MPRYAGERSPGSKTMDMGVALSGGGIRAAVFHLGVLCRLADEDLLEAVNHISTVSGGSLAIAAVIARAGVRWPRSKEYRLELYPGIRRLLTTTDLLSFRAMGWAGLARHGPRLLRDRARLLAVLLEDKWRVCGYLRDLPDRPVWWINATCLETGKNWRFSKREMGDWQFGRHYDPPFRVAEAAAASAALPYILGSLTFVLPDDGWYRTDPATGAPLDRSRPRAQKVRLWDGGAYENLGIEALFKPGRGLVGCDFLVCSDASGPFQPRSRFPFLALLKGHLTTPRLFDISSDQIRSLRARMLVDSLNGGTVKGAYLRMGNSVRDIDIKSGRERDSRAYDCFQTDQEAALALQHPTDLKAISEPLFDRIARHGYELADATLTAYSPAQFSRSLQWA
jgi:NTE family protein